MFFITVFLTMLVSLTLGAEHESQVQIEKVPEIEDQFYVNQYKQHYQKPSTTSNRYKGATMQYLPVQVMAKPLIQPQQTTMLLIPVNAHVLQNLLALQQHGQHQQQMFVQPQRYYDYSTLGASNPEKVNYVPYYYYPSVKSSETENYMPANYLDQSNYEQVIAEPQEEAHQHLTQEHAQSQPQPRPRPQQYHHQQTVQAAKSHYVKHVKNTHHVKN